MSNGVLIVDSHRLTTEGFNLVVAGDGSQHKEIAAMVDQFAHIDEGSLAKLCHTPPTDEP